MKRQAGYKHLPDMLKTHMQIRQCIAIARGILNCLYRLHVRGISQKNLQLGDIYVKIRPTVSSKKKFISFSIQVLYKIVSKLNKSLKMIVVCTKGLNIR